jgi:hypothetical protein
MIMAPSVPACTERAAAGAGVCSEEELTATIVAQKAGHSIRNNPQAESGFSPMAQRSRRHSVVVIRAAMYEESLP